MTKLLFVVIILTVVVHFELSAQSNNDTVTKQQYAKNSIKFSHGDYHIDNIWRGRSLPLFYQFGIYYERRLFRKLYAGFGYGQWICFDGYKFNTYIQNKSAFPAVDALEYRLNYKMLDFYFGYGVNIFKERHFLNFTIGPSYAWGENSYVRWVYINPDPMGDMQITYYTKNEGYLGAIPGVSYDYVFLKNRMIVGANARGRFYNGLRKAQTDYGLHIGLNF